MNILFIQASHLVSDSWLAKFLKGCVQPMMRENWGEVYHKQSLVFWSPLVCDLYEEGALRLGKDVVEDDNDLSHYHYLKVIF